MENIITDSLSDSIKEYSGLLSTLQNEIKKRIVGQKLLIRNLVLALISKGHILLEGVPGLAKTLSINSLANATNLKFSRIQFTPDLLPSDLIGTKIYNQKTANFEIKKGPIFANFILADEINRAPSKVQSALLEAMAEKTVTIGEETFVLQEPFLVLATQNPIEQEGTFILPEAQMDRFLFKTILDYPTENDEIEIMKMFNNNNFEKINSIIDNSNITQIQNLVYQVYVSDSILKYIKDIVFTTREPEKYGLKEFVNYISFGCSPRASIGLMHSAKALALLNGRGFVLPEDVKSIAYDVMRHRIVLSYEALADDVSTDDIISKVLESTKIY